MAKPPATESIEALRRRARHRLIGAVVLVLAGIIGFPLLFDTQPRPVAVDVPISIPDRHTVPALPAPAATPAVADAGKLVVAPAAAPKAPVAPVASPGSAGAAPAPAPAPAAAAPAAARPVPAAPAPLPTAEAVAKKTEPKPEPRPEKRTEEEAADGARARALLQGKDVETVAAASRYVVQVGAFADAGKAREVRLKVERAGLKTYTHVAETREGRRIRVRVGPFPSRAEADRAAEKVKGLDLPAAILTL